MSELSTIRPGILVSLKTTVRGNVNYSKIDIDPEHITPDGKKEATWQTFKQIDDPAEHDEATKIRGKALSIVRGVCVRSDFGLLCPDYKESDLATAIRDARKLTEEFNARAKLTRIGVYVIAGKIAATDAEALRAIRSELSGLVADMEAGIRSVNVEAIREAASKAKNVGQMLNPEQKERLQEAIDVAREQARKLVKAGEQAAEQVNEQTVRALSEYRTQFLDIEDHGVETAAEPTAETAGRAIDFDPFNAEAEPEAAPFDQRDPATGNLIELEDEPAAPLKATGFDPFQPAQLDLI
jgi:ElaB/YqjD/DUF883 family membrane-anchored ribosome-binding protein